MVLGIHVAAGNGSLCCLPLVERIKLHGVVAGRGCEERVGVVNEFRVGRGVRQSGDEEEGGGSEERRREHGDDWRKKIGGPRVKFEAESLLVQ